jgi:hypothetical protein
VATVEVARRGGLADHADRALADGLHRFVERPYSPALIAPSPGDDMRGVEERRISAQDAGGRSN